MLLQGGGRRIQDLMSEFDILPLAERALKIGRPRPLLLASGIFAAAIAAVLGNLLPVHIAFLSASLALALTNVISKEEIYQAVDWPVIVLLAAMIPVGVLLVLMIGTMLVSDVINNNATAVLMAPIAIDLATRLGVNMDSFLMAVAIGASCTFLTPIGHQSNTLVLAPGGYRFSDYWRMGLPPGWHHRDRCRIHDSDRLAPLAVFIAEDLNLCVKFLAEPGWPFPERRYLTRISPEFTAG